MPEGDTIFLAAAELRTHLLGRTVLAAQATGRAQVGRLVGATIESIETVGKNLVIHCSNGLSVRTHLRMTGRWRRFPAGERWQRPPARPALVLKVQGSTVVCFDAPVVEVFATRAQALHPGLAPLGPDLLDPGFDPELAVARFRATDQDRTIGEALLDQRLVAGVGNVFRSEILFIERTDPFGSLARLPDTALERLIATARRLLLANVRPGRPAGRTTTEGAREAAGSPVWVYRRGGRPCRRCGTPIRVAALGRELPRFVWWCPRCQAPSG
ncbi:MAG TPA: DNA-formamidopyrimidine glycosylase family protein [Candidatus Limnocylindrales bacterium]|nr:DNA-formamidopyrimidine glycosylase family protein [Candidatus Limnocylindrales bacterium]